MVSLTREEMKKIVGGNEIVYPQQTSHCWGSFPFGSANFNGPAGIAWQNCASQWGGYQCFGCQTNP